MISGTISNTYLMWGRASVPAQAQRVAAGPLTAVLDEGTLRDLSLDGHVLIGAVYVAVRDENWRSILPAYSSLSLSAMQSSFELRFVAEHVAGDIDFVWNGRISGSDDGTITFSMDGLARSRFRKNRIGLCVLHPSSLAASSVAVETSDGIIRGHLPKRIAPWPVLFDIRAIRHSVGSGRYLEVSFAGDTFEMEDQRNWSDPSFKTYCTPRGLTIPIEVAPGDRFVQSVSIALTGPRLSKRPRAARTASITVVPESGVPLPRVGLGAGASERVLTAHERDALRGLNLSHLRADIDLRAKNWRDALSRACADAAVLDVKLEVEAVASPNDEDLEELILQLGDHTSLISQLALFDWQLPVATERLLRMARAIMQKANLPAGLRGGTRSNFAFLNRIRPPLSLIDSVGYAITPQVHTFDNRSLVESLKGQRETALNARIIAGSLPVSVSSVTLRERFNAVGRGIPPQDDPRGLPSTVDGRQISLFAAGWTMGSVRSLGEGGASSATYYETTGWRGVMESDEGSPLPEEFPSAPGMLFPVYYVLAVLGGVRRGRLLPIRIDGSDSLEAIAVRQDNQFLVGLANLNSETQDVRLRVPKLIGLVERRMDTSTRGRLVATGNLPSYQHCQLPPFGLIVLSGELAGN